MKLLIVSDLHGNSACIQAILNAKSILYTAEFCKEKIRRYINRIRKLPAGQECGSPGSPGEAPSENAFRVFFFVYTIIKYEYLHPVFWIFIMTNDEIR